MSYYTFSLSLSFSIYRIFLSLSLSSAEFPFCFSISLSISFLSFSFYLFDESIKSKYETRPAFTIFRFFVSLGWSQLPKRRKKFFVSNFFGFSFRLSSLEGKHHQNIDCQNPNCISPSAIRIDMCCFAQKKVWFKIAKMSYRSYLLPKLRDQLVGQGMNEVSSNQNSKFQTIFDNCKTNIFAEIINRIYILGFFNRFYLL